VTTLEQVPAMAGVIGNRRRPSCVFSSRLAL